MATFLDTNILLRFLLRDDEAKYQNIAALLKRVERQDEQVSSSDLVIAEIVWILEKSPYGLPRSRIHGLITPIVGFAGLALPDKSVILDALDLYAQTRIDYIDAYNVAVMRRRRIDRIYSYDRDFDRVPGLTRVEP